MTARAAGEAWPDGRANGNELDREGLYACPGLLRLGRKLNLCGGEAASVLTTPSGSGHISLALDELTAGVWASIARRVGPVRVSMGEYD